MNCTMTFWVKPESQQPFCSVECYEVTTGKSWLGFGRKSKEGVGGNIWRKGAIKPGSPGQNKRAKLEEARMRKELSKPQPIQLGSSRRRA